MVGRWGEQGGQRTLMPLCVLMDMRYPAHSHADERLVCEEFFCVSRDVAARV